MYYQTGSSMLLAEALLLRADLQKRQSSLRARIKRYLVVQEGDEPAEDPKTLLVRLRAENEELARLVVAINHTNEIQTVSTDRGEVTLTQALCWREHMQNMASVLRYLADESDPYYRCSRTEIRNVPVMSPAKLQSQADDFTRDVRELVLALQKVNWSVDLEGFERSDADPKAGPA